MKVAFSDLPPSPNPPGCAGRAGCILAVDPALRTTGYAILQSHNHKIACLQHGTIRNHRLLPLAGCLEALHRHTQQLLRDWQPEALAIEGIIYVQSHRTAITLGAARGAVILAAAQGGLPVHEYAPRRVKQAVVGRGAAAKSQVGFMVRALLGLDETPSPDAADAIAIGIAHFHAVQAGVTRGQPLKQL